MEARFDSKSHPRHANRHAGAQRRGVRRPSAAFARGRPRNYPPRPLESPLHTLTLAVTAVGTSHRVRPHAGSNFAWPLSSADDIPITPPTNPKGIPLPCPSHSGIRLRRSQETTGAPASRSQAGAQRRGVRRPPAAFARGRPQNYPPRPLESRPVPPPPGPRRHGGRNPIGSGITQVLTPFQAILTFTNIQK